MRFLSSEVKKQVVDLVAKPFGRQGELRPWMPGHLFHDVRLMYYIAHVAHLSAVVCFFVFVGFQRFQSQAAFGFVYLI